MTPAQWQKVNELFDLALEAPADTWAKLVADAEDPEVSAELSALLDAHARSGSFLAEPVVKLGTRGLASRVSRLFEAPRAFAAGETVEDFEILRLVGEGAFAKVYLSRQISLSRQVALKVSADVGKEARVMAGLEHDHIVPVFSETILPDKGLKLVCMQFVHGATLQKVIDRLAELPPESRSGQAILDIVDRADEVSGALFNPAALRDRERLGALGLLGAGLWIGCALAEALAFAHERGILHLDVKPANIMLNRYGRPMLTDFNVSLTPEDIAEGNMAGLGGTISYMPPEQSELFRTRDTRAMQAIDHRADVYALGVVLTELLTCAKVWPSPKAEKDGAPHVLRGTEVLPDEVSAVLHVATRAQAKDRFDSAARFADALRNCLRMAEVRRNLPVAGRWPEFARRRPVLGLVILAALPQVMGSVVNITYNAVRVVDGLTPEQKDVFESTILPYNVLFYPLGLWLVWRQLAFLIRSLQRRRDRYMPDPASMSALRRRVLRTPYALFAAATVGWLPGAIIFPAVIDWVAGPIAASVYMHFAISFVSSWLIALTYSFLLLEAVILQVVYPQFWTGTCDIRGSARTELAHVTARLTVFQILAGIIPLAGAAMIVGAGPEAIDPERYWVFQVMVVGLISLGMCGFVFAIKTAENVKRTVSAFTGVSIN